MKAKKFVKKLRKLLGPADSDIARFLGGDLSETPLRGLLLNLQVLCEEYVVPPDVTSKFCKDYIKFAKDVGADAVSFRKVASDVTPTKAERKFAEKYGVGSETKCPVCRGMEQTVKGFPVRWKGSVEEPSLETKGIYEVVIHPDGLAYSDWGRTTLIPTLNKQAPPKRKTVSVRASGCQGRSSGRGGCGGGGGGCGGGRLGSSGCGSSGIGGC